MPVKEKDKVMKTAFKLSVMLNLVLVVWGVFILTRPQTDKSAVGSPFTPDAKAPSPAVEPAPAAVVPHKEPQSFSWAQLESPDYRTYVKNLRAIHCPEATVRAIVAADVHASYGVRIGQLEDRLSALTAGSWSTRLASYDTEQALRAEISRLSTEEPGQVADLLGLTPNPAKSAASTVSQSPATDGNEKPASVTNPIASVTSETQNTTAIPTGIQNTQAVAMIQAARRKDESLGNKPATLPLAFQPVDATGLKLNPDQMQAINNLQQYFIQKIGGADQNPSDPAYRAKWARVQPEVDDKLLAILGYAGYYSYQMAAYKKWVEQNYP